MVRKEIPELTGRSLVGLARQVAAASHQEVNESKPLLSAALPSGERIQIILPPPPSMAAASRSAAKSSSI